MLRQELLHDPEGWEMSVGVDGDGDVVETGVPDIPFHMGPTSLR